MRSGSKNWSCDTRGFEKHIAMPGDAGAVPMQVSAMQCSSSVHGVRADSHYNGTGALCAASGMHACWPRQMGGCGGR